MMRLAQGKTIATSEQKPAKYEITLNPFQNGIYFFLSGIMLLNSMQFVLHLDLGLSIILWPA